MAYRLLFTHINPDFAVEPKPEGAWTLEVAEDAELMRVLNRMAIATTHVAVVDFPEVEITMGTRRAVVTAVNGELFYTELGSHTRRDLKAQPEEVLRLLLDLPLDQVFAAPAGAGAKDDGEERAHPPAARARRSVAARRMRAVFLAFLAAIIAYSWFIVWRELTERPRLHDAPDFTAASAHRAAALLGEWRGVYASDYREGGMVFELSGDGGFRMFELWRLKQSRNLALLPILRERAQPGVSQGKWVFLVGKHHVLEPFGDDSMKWRGGVFRRHYGPLEEIGEVVEVE